MSNATAQKVQSSSFEPLPEGDYLVRMQDLKEGKSKKGDVMLTAKFQVISGPEGIEGAKNRVIFENFLLTHQNDKVVEIARGKLDKYAKAIGINDGLEGLGEDIGQLEKYLETPFIATLGTKEPYNGRTENRIMAFKAR